MIDKITLNFMHCRYLGEIDEVIKKAFKFPDWYGANWSAMEDFLCAYTDRETLIEIVGFKSLPKELADNMKIMLDILAELHKDSPNISYRILS